MWTWDPTTSHLHFDTRQASPARTSLSDSEHSAGASSRSPRATGTDERLPETQPQVEWDGPGRCGLFPGDLHRPGPPCPSSEDDEVGSYLFYSYPAPRRDGKARA